MLLLRWRRSVVDGALGGSLGRCLEELLEIIRTADMIIKGFISHTRARGKFLQGTITMSHINSRE